MRFLKNFVNPSFEQVLEIPVWFECRNLVLGDEKRFPLGYVLTHLLGAGHDNEGAEAAEIDVLSLGHKYINA